MKAKELLLMFLVAAAVGVAAYLTLKRQRPAPAPVTAAPMTSATVSASSWGAASSNAPAAGVDRVIVTNHAPEANDAVGPQTRSRFVLPAGVRMLPLVADKKPGWNAVRKSVMDRVKNDPKSAAEWVSVNIKSGGDLAFALTEIGLAWASKDPRAALAWAQGLDSGRECALRAVFQAWAQSDPAAAAAGIGKIENFETKNLAIGTIAYYWAKTDLKSAMSWAWKLPEGTGKVYALSNIARQIETDRSAAGGRHPEPGTDVREIDPEIVALASIVAPGNPAEVAGRMAKRLPGGRQCAPVLRFRLADWASRDADAASEWAAQVAGDRAHENALLVVAGALASSNPRLAAEISAAIPAGAEKDSTVTRIAEAWALSDAAAAEEWAQSLSVEQGRDAALEAVRNAGTEALPDDTQSPEEPQAEQDPGLLPEDILRQDRSIAISLAEQLPDGSMRDGVVHAIATEWAKEAPEAAIAWAVEQLPEGRVADTAVRAIIWDWTARDAAAVEAWAGALSEPARREHALSSIALALVRSQPASAAAVVETMAPGGRKYSTVANVAGQWAITDVSAATQWASGLSEEQGRDYALAQVAASRAKSNIDSTLAWAQGLPAGKPYESALGGIAYAAANSDIRQALSLVQGLPEGPGREKALPAVASKLARDNPDSAVEWVNALPAGPSRDLAIQSVVESINSSASLSTAEKSRLLGLVR